MNVGEILAGPVIYGLVLIPPIALLLLSPLIRGALFSGIVLLLFTLYTVIQLSIEDISGARGFEVSDERNFLTWTLIIIYVLITVFLVMKNKENN